LPWGNDDALALRRGVLRENHPDLARSEILMGAILMDQGRAVQAELHLAEVVAIRQASTKPRPARIARGRLQWGLCLLELKRYAEAQTQLAQAETVLLAERGADDPEVIEARAALAEVERWTR